MGSHFSDQGSVQEIAGVKLQVRFGRKHLQFPPTLRFVYTGRQVKRVATLVGEDEVVVVPLSNTELPGVGVDVLPDWNRLSKIEGGASYRAKFPSRNEDRGDGREGVGVDCQLVVENCSVPFALEVELAVLRKIDGRGLRRGGPVLQRKLIVLGEPIGSLYVEPARIAPVPVGTDVPENDSYCSLHLEWLSPPGNLVEARRPAVQVIGAVVGL